MSTLRCSSWLEGFGWCSQTRGSDGNQQRKECRWMHCNESRLARRPNETVEIPQHDGSLCTHLRAPQCLVLASEGACKRSMSHFVELSQVFNSSDHTWRPRRRIDFVSMDLPVFSSAIGRRRMKRRSLCVFGRDISKICIVHVHGRCCT